MLSPGWGGVAHVECVEGGPVGAARCRPLRAGRLLGPGGIRAFFFAGVAVRTADLCSVHQVFERPKLQERPRPVRARRVRAARGEAERRLVANFAEGMVRTRCGEAGLAKNSLAERAHAGLVELADDEGARDERQGHVEGRRSLLRGRGSMVVPRLLLIIAESKCKAQEQRRATELRRATEARTVGESTLPRDRQNSS